MDKFFRRSMHKKGFTMVELLVVIAIIGILAALVLPNLLSSDVPEKGKAYAKSYYFTAQEFFSRQKIAADPNNLPLDPVVSDFYFYTTVDEFGRPTESGVVSASLSNMTSADDMQSNGSASAAYKKIMLDFETFMDRNLKECDYAGTYYLVVDNDFRVQATYWSDATISELRSNSPNLRFEDDNVISGYWCCAFPTEMSSVAGVSDRAMFDYTY